LREGFPRAEVEARVLPAGHAQADLAIRVDRGDRVRIKDVLFEGQLGLPVERLRQTLQATAGRRWFPAIPPLWRGWRRLAPYTAGRIDADLAALRSLYAAEGYFDAAVGLKRVRIESSRASVIIQADSGPRYQVRDIQVTTPERTISFDPANGRFPIDDFCECVSREQRRAEQQGRHDFRVEMAWEPAPGEKGPAAAAGHRIEPAPQSNAGTILEQGSSGPVRVSARVEPGLAYHLGQLEFRGNHKLRDATLRRAFSLDEGDPLDPEKLRRSLRRLNQTGLIETLSEADVEARWLEDQSVDLTISVREAKRGRWSISGPLGPVSLFGPLRLSIESRLPAWGRDLFELSTYFVAAGILSYTDPLAAILTGNKTTLWQPFVAVRRPLLPGQWASGFLWSPSVDWKQSLAYSGILRGRAAASQVLAPAAGGLLLEVPVFRGQAPTTGALQHGAVLCQPNTSLLGRLRTAGRVALTLLAGAP
jgi:hypothetical protein